MLHRIEIWLWAIYRRLLFQPSKYKYRQEHDIGGRNRGPAPLPSRRHLLPWLTPLSLMVLLLPGVPENSCIDSGDASMWLHRALFLLICLKPTKPVGYALNQSNSALSADICRPATA